MRLFLLPLLLVAGVAAAQEVAPVSGITLDPSTGSEIGPIFETWMSPHQEGGEEQNTPRLVPGAFKSTTPSVDRDERPSRGHATLAFSRDLSTAYAHIAIEGVNPEDIVMFHIHCGRPGQLGPIIVDFGLENDLAKIFADGEASLEITNEDIVAASEHGHGLVSAFVAGCPITLAVPTDKVVTVAGLAHIAYERELYYNLHTSGQTYFGDIRGQLYPVERAEYRE